MTKHPETKKEKQRKKNRKNWELFLHFDRFRDNVDIAAPEFKPPPPPPEKSKEDKQQEIWSAKLHEVKNLNTGRREAAKERWNRFAATSDAGSRGR
jgi:hypothetical protein